MSQFSTTKSNIGDLSIEAGGVVDVTGSTSVIYDISPRTSESVQDNQTTSATRSAPRFAGGSSRNMLIKEKINADIPNGWFKQVQKYQWSAEDSEAIPGADSGLKITVSADGGLEWSDGFDNVIMTAPPGSIPLPNQIVCGQLASSGNITTDFTSELGTDTGLVTLNFDTFKVPSSFVVEYDGVEVINTGYRGTSGTYDGQAVVVAGPASGSASFTKTTASPTTCTVRAIAPFSGDLCGTKTVLPDGVPVGFGVFVTAEYPTIKSVVATGQIDFRSNPAPGEDHLIFTAPAALETYIGAGGEVFGKIVDSSGIYGDNSGSYSVTVCVALASGTSTWGLELSCPGGGSPPYPPVYPGRSEIVATSTAYGESLNGGSPFTLDVIYEGKELATELTMTSAAIGVTPNFTEINVTEWAAYQYRCEIDANGLATISDQSDIIAIRPNIAGFISYLDPSGSYASTAYGRDTYNNGVDFSVAINMVITPPLELYTYLEATTSGHSLTSVRGPFSAPVLPDNDHPNHKLIVPISYSDGLGNVTQYFEGSILWK